MILTLAAKGNKTNNNNKLTTATTAYTLLLNPFKVTLPTADLTLILSSTFSLLLHLFTSTFNCVFVGESGEFNYNRRKLVS